MEPVTSSLLSDRRSSYRVPVRLAAAVRTPIGFASSYAVDDLSLGGALLRGGPVIAKGQEVTVAIRGVGLPSMTLSGRVVRHSGLRSARPRWAVRFREVSAEAEDAIHDLSVAVLERAPSVLVVDRSPETRADLAAEIRAIGLRPFTAATPLEAIALLQMHGDRVASVVVGRLSDPDVWLGFLGFLGSEYPEVRRVALTASTRRSHETVERQSVDSVPADSVLFARSGRGALKRALDLGR